MRFVDVRTITGVMEKKVVSPVSLIDPEELSKAGARIIANFYNEYYDIKSVDEQYYIKIEDQIKREKEKKAREEKHSNGLLDLIIALALL